MSARSCSDPWCACVQGCFPEADKDPVIQIASLVSVQGQATPAVRNVMTLDQCAPIVGAEVMSFRTEAQMLKVHALACGSGWRTSLPVPAGLAVAGAHAVWYSFASLAQLTPSSLGLVGFDVAAAPPKPQADTYMSRVICHNQMPWFSQSLPSCERGPHFNDNERANGKHIWS